MAEMKRVLDEVYIVEGDDIFTLGEFYKEMRIIYRSGSDNNYNGDYAYITLCGRNKVVENKVRGYRDKIMQFNFIPHDKEYIASVDGRVTYIKESDSEFAFRLESKVL